MQNDPLMHYFFHIFKKQNATTNDAVKRTIEAVTEIWLRLGITMKSSWLHSKQILKKYTYYNFYVFWKTLRITNAYYIIAILGWFRWQAGLFGK